MIDSRPQSRRLLRHSRPVAGLRGGRSREGVGDHSDPARRHVDVPLDADPSPGEGAARVPGRCSQLVCGLTGGSAVVDEDIRARIRQGATLDASRLAFPDHQRAALTAQPINQLVVSYYL